MNRLNKNNLFYAMLLLIAVLLNSCCLTCENVLCNRAELYEKGFDMPNLITILNPKDTFNINDTLWMRIEFPASFFGDKKSCGYNSSFIEIVPFMDVYYNSKQFNSLIGSLSLIPIKGVYDFNRPAAYNFSLQNNNIYVAEMGLILNDTSINSIGVDTSLYDWNPMYKIRLSSNLNTGCIYDDDNCAIGKKRHPYELGFHIFTTFQGGVNSWKINMRK